MNRTCETCGAIYDDVVKLTVCPHRRFISDEDAAQKDLALRLLGKDLRWAHLGAGTSPILRIESIGPRGMVTLAGWSGEFAPHLFVVVVEPMTITVKYSCHDCGLVKAECVVPARQDEDVVVWMEHTIRLAAQDHARRSPRCHPKQLHDLMIPMPPGTDRVGGPATN